MSSRLRWYWGRLQRARARLAEERMLELRFPTARFEEGVRVVSPHLLELGEDVLIQRYTLLHCGGLAWTQGEGRIRLGNRCTISPNCVFWGGGGIVAGDDFHVGPGAMVFSSRDDYEDARRVFGQAPPEWSSGHVFAPVTFGDGVRLWSGAIVGPGVTVGSNADIAAGAVVLRDVPAGAMVGGVPARVLREA